MAGLPKKEATVAWFRKDERTATKVYEFSCPPFYSHVSLRGAVTLTTDWRGFFPSSQTHRHRTDPRVFTDTGDVLCSHWHSSGSERQSLTEMMVRCAVCCSKMISIGDTRFAITFVEYYGPALSSLLSFFILLPSVHRVQSPRCPQCVSLGTRLHPVCTGWKRVC